MIIVAKLMLCVGYTQVRLAYAGRELDPAKDDDYFEIKADNAVMHTMQRMKGGSCNSS